MAQVGLAQHLGAVADLALAGEEHQHVAGAFAHFALMGRDFIQGAKDALVHGQVVEQRLAVFVDFGGQGPVPGIHRVGAAGNLDDRRLG
ncbi:hypothetical protein FQZ97_1195660 [compost metagenome]